MANKLQQYTELANRTTARITNSYQEWTAFLATAGRVYKYPFPEQLMIYAQRPEATACAEYDFWNQRMRRYVRRNSEGIALIDNSGGRPVLRYVFDVSDTGSVAHEPPPYLWKYEDEHRDTVTAALENRYGVSGAHGLAEQLENIATRLAGEYWNEHQRDILDIVDGSFLEEYDDFNVGATFRNAAAVSITYTLMSRCGLEPERFFQHEDFLSIFDFNTRATVSALGMAVSQTSEQVLRQIEVTIKKYEREKSAERTAQNERTDIQPERGLSDSRPDAGRSTEQGPGQVREDAEEVSGGTPARAVGDDGGGRDAVPAPAGDRGRGQREVGADDAGAGESGGRDGGTESVRPAAVDRPDEHLQGPGGGSDLSGAGVRIIQEEQSGQFNLFPTEQEQIESIREAESVNEAPSAFSISQDEIDHILRVGSNTENARMKIVTEFSKHAQDYADILKSMYHGGYGIETGAGMLSAWYAEDGIHLARGTGAEYAADAQVISWVDAARWVNELLEEGRFATNVEIAEAPGFELRELAQSILYLAHDLSGEAMERGLLSTYRSFWREGYPAQTEKIAAMLADPDTRDALVEEYRQFMIVWRSEPNVLRFRYHRPAELMNRLNELKLSRQEYHSEMAELPEVRQRITEDEINHHFTDASKDRRLAVYAYWQQNHTSKEKEKFIRNQYGTGGGNNALSHNFDSWLDYEGKGRRFRKQDCGTIEERWSKIVRRLDDLISSGRYLNELEMITYQSRYLAQAPEQEAEQTELEAMETPVIEAVQPLEAIPEESAPEAPAGAEAAPEEIMPFPDYAAIKLSHSDDIVLYQVGDFYELYSIDAENAAPMLGLTMTTRPIPGVGRVTMCGFPVADLDQYVQQLRDKYDVTVSGIAAQTGERTTVSFLSIDHEAQRDIDLHEGEFGADGTRAFLDSEANENGWSAMQNRTEDNPFTSAKAAPKREITQEDIDNAIRAWNGSIQSKQAVVRHMEMYARDKKTAEWLAMEFAATTDPFRVSIDGAETTVPWPKVQRRIAQLIKADHFYTEQEYDRFDDVDPIAIREKLEQGEESPFVRQVMADAEAIAQAEREAEAATRPTNPQEQENSNYGLAERLYSFLKEHNAEEFESVFYSGKSDAEIISLYVEQFNDTLIVTETLSEIELIVAEENLTETQAEEAQHLIADLESLLPQELLEAYREENGSVENKPAEETSAPSASAYKVGDTVYLDNTAYQITEIRDNSVQLLDPALAYPIFRAEERTQFEAALYQDRRNSAITDILSIAENAPAMPSETPAQQNGVDNTSAAPPIQSERKRLGTTRPEINYRRFAELFPEIINGEYRYLRLEAGPSMMPLHVQWIGEDTIAIGHTYEMNGDTMNDPEMTFRVDRSAGTLEPLTFQQDGYPSIYQEVYPEPGKWRPNLRSDLNTFARQWFGNIAEQGYKRVRAVAEIDGEDVDISFDENGNRVTEPETEAAPPSAEESTDTPVMEASQPTENAGASENIEQLSQEERQEAEQPAEAPISEQEFTPEPEQAHPSDPPAKENFRITDDNLGVGGPKTKYRMNVEAIRTLKQIEMEGRTATATEQEVLSRYVGWGGIPNAFDPDKEDWSAEYVELKNLLTEDEYRSARASTLNAHYTSPAVIKAIYEALGNMGFENGNILDKAVPRLIQENGRKCAENRRNIGFFVFSGNISNQQARRAAASNVKKRPRDNDRKSYRYPVGYR